MLIVGELINSSRKLIHNSLVSQNIKYLLDIARKQVEAGADYLDVNCSTMLAKEPEVLSWLIENVEAANQKTKFSERGNRDGKTKTGSGGRGKYIAPTKNVGGEECITRS